jgi:hypothetical protein
MATFGDHGSIERLAYASSNPHCEHEDEPANGIGWAQ